MKYQTQDTEAGNTIDTFASRIEAEKAIAEYEIEDKKDNTYTPDFYSIVTME